MLPAGPGPLGHRGGAVHYLEEDRPFVTVLHPDGRWYPGRLHSWVREGRGWRAVVSYRPGDDGPRLVDLPADHVRRADPPST